MQAFQEHFGFAAATVGRAPGRVNLLGDHTDYNEGFVLPTPISQHTEVGIAPSADGINRCFSVQLDCTVEFRDGIAPAAGFASYVYGCIEVLRERGIRMEPISLCIDSQVPLGAGLSSSAALEVAVLRAFRTLYDIDIEDAELALLAQQAEVRFAGVRCGIMDQMASSLGTPHHMLFLDTRSLEHKLLPLPEDGELLILDSGVPRSLAASGYNERRAQCDAAAHLLQVRALRDIEQVSAADGLPPPLNARARHVIAENSRVLTAATGVDARGFGALMNASHASLRDDFEVSTPELNFLVAQLQAHPDVHGARLTGAGFGGACVALVRAGRRDDVAADLLAAYGDYGAHRGSALFP